MNHVHNKQIKCTNYYKMNKTTKFEKNQKIPHQKISVMISITSSSNNNIFKGIKFLYRYF